MIITRVYGSDGTTLMREYPDAFAQGAPGKCMYIWDVALANDKQKKDKDGWSINERDKGVNIGNWIACITGPAIIIEEHQDEGS
jgi:hypothetical protein